MKYDNGRKNNWRGRVWNCITERLTVKPRDAVVLYLAGDDLDREKAIQKGFSDHNLIAIDRDKNIVSRIRQDSHLAVHATLRDVIVRWAVRPVHVVICDLCSGVNGHVLYAANSLAIKPEFKDSVVVFNLLAGRETKFYSSQNAPYFKENRAKSIYNGQFSFLYRLLRYKWKDIDEAMLAQGEIETPTPRGTDITDSLLYQFLSANTSKLAKRHPIFFNYISVSGQRFDTGIWNNISLPKIGERTGLDPMPLSSGSLETQMDRKLNALRAVQTRYEKEYVQTCN